MSSTAGSVGFIGGGVMAEAMIEALLAKGLVRPAQLIVGEIAAERRQLLHERHGVQVTASNLEPARAEVLVLAVKPQLLRTVMSELRGQIAAETVILSIVAGARLEALAEGLAHRLLVRAMPNTPARVGMAATVWTATPELKERQLARVHALLGALGTELAVESETFVEMATGLTGPMPAFVFLIVEAFVDAGVGLGFPREQAMALTLQSMRGSLELMHRTGEHPAILRNEVTSPGGATVAGLLALEKAGLRATLAEAVRAVRDRAATLVND